MINHQNKTKLVNLISNISIIGVDFAPYSVFQTHAGDKNRIICGVIGFKFHIKPEGIFRNKPFRRGHSKQFRQPNSKNFPFGPNQVGPTKDAVLLAGTILYLAQMLKM